MNFDNIYLEEEITELTETKRILNNINYQNIVTCKNYKEIFNPKNQNFRIQKLNPSIILAKKKNNFVLETPKNFTIGYKKNFYFSHMFNCIFDCKYCFLQGMFNSPNFVIFVNYYDFIQEIKMIANSTNEKFCFFSGYDCDSLAFERITGFIKYFLEHFKNLNNAYLEVRTKSVNIDFFKKKKVLENVIIAFSLNPQVIIDQFEIKTPNLEKRLKAMISLQNNGWKIGLRFDPIIWIKNYKKHYRDFFKKIFESLDKERIHSITLGGFRMPKSYFKKMLKIYPNDPFFLKNYLYEFEQSQKKEKYKKNAINFCLGEIKQYIEKEKIFLN